jgi:CHASE2 domain-containing sensor protein
MLEAVINVAVIVVISLVYIHYLHDLSPFIPLILCLIICFPILYAGEMKKHRANQERRDE